jgi:hypothetical protein
VVVVVTVVVVVAAAVLVVVTVVVVVVAVGVVAVVRHPTYGKRQQAGHCPVYQWATLCSRDRKPSLQALIHRRQRGEKEPTTKEPFR